MKINVKSVMVAADGTTIREQRQALDANGQGLVNPYTGQAVLVDGDDLVLATVLKNAAVAPNRGQGQEMTLAEQLQRGDMVRRVTKALNGDGEMDITLEEAAVFKDWIGKIGSPMITYAAVMLIDPEVVITPITVSNTQAAPRQR